MQLQLSFEPGLALRYRDVRECLAASVYARGLGRVASTLDLQPSNLSAMLSGDRHLPIDVVESYMREFHDTTPALYIAARYLQDDKQVREQALAQIPALVDKLSRLMAEAGAP